VRKCEHVQVSVRVVNDCFASTSLVVMGPFSLCLSGYTLHVVDKTRKRSVESETERVKNEITL